MLDFFEKNVFRTQEERIDAYRFVFNNEQGQAVLKDMYLAMYDSADQVLDPQSMSFMAGRRSAVKEIINLTKTGEQNGRILNTRANRAKQQRLKPDATQQPISRAD